MFQRKTPKTQEADKTKYTIYNPHTIDTNQRRWPEVIRVVSIDPGIQNYAIRVEDRPFNPASKQPIVTILYDKLRLKKTDTTLTNNHENATYSILTDYLDSHLEIFMTCAVVIIERQLPINYKAVRVSQHTITYFMVLLKNAPLLPVIFEVDARLKGEQLGASNHLNSHGLKAWAVVEAKKLLTWRNDRVALSILGKNKKCDDLSDTVCQIEALFQYLGWPPTPEPQAQAQCPSSLSSLKPANPRLIINEPLTIGAEPSIPIEARDKTQKVQVVENVIRAKGLTLRLV